AARSRGCGVLPVGSAGGSEDEGAPGSLLTGRGGAIVVDAFERQAIRRIAHVGVEGFEDQPSFADAALAVRGVSVVIWVEAPLQLARPNFVDTGARFPVRCDELFPLASAVG